MHTNIPQRSLQTIRLYESPEGTVRVGACLVSLGVTWQISLPEKVQDYVPFRTPFALCISKRVLSQRPS